ncbi:MAG: FimV/HubP family polar landmark protein [Neptuniibacter sp.]
MLRKLAVSLAVAGVISASNANALGLGEIKVNSALNEPLKAEIKLLQVRKLNPLQIQPRMANIDDFALAGLSKAGFLKDVSFQVKVNSDGSGIIYLNSSRPVREPFLNFLVEVNWPNGRMVREYTLLLDPPVFDPTPVRKTIQPSSPSQPVLKQPERQVSKKAAVPSRSTGGGSAQFRVDAKDTLWALAIKHRPNQQVSVKQMMIALQKKNPHAFIDNNINALKQGVVMDVPGVDEIQQLSDRDAAREVVRQTAEWKARKTTSEAPSPKVASAKKSVTGEQPEPSPEKTPEVELKIVTPKDTLEPEKGLVTDQSEALSDETPVDSAEESDSTDETLSEPEVDGEGEGEGELTEVQANNAELEERLNQSLEDVDKITRENVELSERMDGIQYELEKLREMLELKDKELAVLQNQVDTAKAEPPPPEKGFLDTLLGSPALLGGIAAAIIAFLAGLLFFLRKGNKEEEPTEKEVAAPVPEDMEPEVTETDPEVAAEEPEAVPEEPDDLDDLDFDAEEDLLKNDDLDLDNEDLSDLDDLDLDMDLDLEEDEVDVLETVEKADDINEEELLDNDEFDLGVDDIEDEDSNVSDELNAILSEDSESIADDESDISDELDSLLAEDAAELENELEASELTSAEEPEISDELDSLLAEDSEILEDASQDPSDELDELAFEVAEQPEPLEEPEDNAQEATQDEADELDFILSESEGLESPSDDTSEGDLEIQSDDSIEDELDFSELSAPEEIPEGLDEMAVEPTDSAIDQAEDDIDHLLDEVEPETEESQSLEDLASMIAESDLEPESQALKLDEVEVEEPLDDVDSDPDFDSLISEVDEEIEAGQSESNDSEEGEDSAVESPVLTPEVALDSELDLDLDLDDMDLSEVASEAESEEIAPEAEFDEAGDDLDSMLDDIGMDLEEVDLTKDKPASDAGELEEAMAHDLDADLDSELDALLNSADNDIELEESSADEGGASMDEDFDELAGLNLLEGADEVETKLDLARAYMDMEDFDGAKDILQEIVAEGSDEQKAEAESLIQAMNDS